MRLIDADALKEDMRGKLIDSVEERIVIRRIDNAQTIEPEEEFEWCHDCKEYDQEKHCCPRWSKQIRKTVAKLEEYYKPKCGVWIKPYDDESILITGRCSACGWESHLLEDDVVGMPFCPNCGARMKGKDNE